MPIYVFNSFDDPSGPGSTEAWGINDLDHIVGSYRDATGDHGFFYDAGSGTYLTLTDPSGPQRTFARGINSSDQIVGYYLDAGSNFHAFFQSRHRKLHDRRCSRGDRKRCDRHQRVGRDHRLLSKRRRISRLPA